MANEFKKFTIQRLIEPYARKYVGLGSEENFNAFFNPVATSADLADPTSDINTTDKYLGKPAYDETLGEPVWATGPLSSDSWDQATGGGGGGGAFTLDAQENLFAGTGAGATLNVATERNFLAILNAGARLTSGDDNIGIGGAAGRVITTGSFNIAIGSSAMGDNAASMTGTNNVAIGQNTLGGSITAADNNIALGVSALNSITTGDSNIGIGVNVGDQLTTQTSNILIGGSAGETLNGASAHFNIAIGVQALADASTGADNVGIGRSAGEGITTASNNVAIGIGAMGNAAATFTGNNNVAIGVNAMNSATGNVSASNQAIGQGVLDNANGALGNQGMGDNALNAVTSGDFNISFGHNSGGSITTGSDNIMIGHNAGPTTNLSSQLFIDIIETDRPLIHGNFSTDIVTLHGNTNVTMRLDSGNTSSQQIIQFMDTGFVNATVGASTPGGFLDLIHRAVNNSDVGAQIRLLQQDADFRGSVAIDAGGSNGVPATEHVLFSGLESVGSDLADFTSRVRTSASTTTRAGFNLVHGAAPTSPANGDMWTTTAGLFVRINGSTVGPLS